MAGRTGIIFEVRSQDNPWLSIHLHGIRIAAFEGLTVLNSSRSLPGILRRLKDRYPDVRQSAVNAVAVLRTARNLKDIRPLVYDKKAQVAAAAESPMRALSASDKSIP